MACGYKTFCLQTKSTLLSLRNIFESRMLALVRVFYSVGPKMAGSQSLLGERGESQVVARQHSLCSSRFMTTEQEGYTGLVEAWYMHKCWA
jgi:hypothetical protein